jgi:hypothetical protein
MFFVASNQSPSRRLSRNVAGGHAPPLGQACTHPRQIARSVAILRFVDDSARRFELGIMGIRTA